MKSKTRFEKLFFAYLVIAAIAFALDAIRAFADPTTNAPSVTVAWDQSPEAMVNGYKVYWGVSMGNYTNSIAVPGRTNTVATISNLTRNVTYWITATCTATNGLESGYAIPVSYTTTGLPAPPFNVKATTLQP